MFGIPLFRCELSEYAALWAAEGHNRNHQIAVEFEIAKKCLVGSRTRMPMTANSLGIVIRNEAAFHFFMAIGADGCLFHLSFLVVFAVSVTWLGSDAASGCLSGITFHAIELDHSDALAYGTSHPLPLKYKESSSQEIDNMTTTAGITAPDGPMICKPPAINIV